MTPALVLDLDGTVHPGTVGSMMLDDLSSLTGTQREAATAAVAAVAGRAAGTVSARHTIEQVHANYGIAVAGLRHETLKTAACCAWSRCRPTVFDFVGPLLAAAKRRGYVVVLISGSPYEAVEQAADDLKIRHRFGLRVAVVDGRCESRLECAPGRPGEKRRCLESITERLSLDLPRSLALGDTSTDCELLEIVGTPIAFEPDAELAAIARTRGWSVADRTTALSQCLTAMESHCRIERGSRRRGSWR